MEYKLKEMFPAGEWGTGQRAWMVKDGTYFCAAADIVAGKIVLTDLGKRLTVGAVENDTIESLTALAPAEVVSKISGKKPGLKA